MMLKGNFKIDNSKAWPFVLGLDIGPQSIKYAVLRRTPTGKRVEGFGRYSMEEKTDNMESQIHQFIRWLFKKNRGLKKARIVVGVDNPQLVIRQESFPPLSKKELLQTTRFGIEQELGAEGTVEVVCAFEAMGKDEEKQGNTKYMTIGLPEEGVVENVQAMADHGVIPTKVTATVMAVSNLIPFLPQEYEKQTIGILDVGSERSILVVFRKGRMDFFREIGVGGSDITKSIIGTIFHEGKAIQFSVVEATEFKLKYGYPLGFSEGMTFKGAPLSEIGAMMRPMIERLMSEIQRSISFYRDSSKSDGLDALFLIGGGARLKHLPEVLQGKLGLPVSLFPPPKNLKIMGGREKQQVFARKFPELAVAAALSLESSLTCNLLPETYQRIHRVRNIQKYLAAGMAASILILGLISIQMKSSEVQLKELVKSKEALIARSENRTHRFMTLQNQLILVQNQFAGMDDMAMQDPTLVQVLRLFSHVVPDQLILTYLGFGKEAAQPANAKAGRGKNEAEIKAERGVRIRGMKDRPPADVGVYLAQLIVALEKSGYFSEVRMEKDMWTEERDEYRFELVAVLKNQ
ncbi:MAG TPA: hypothetical protein ENN03_02120 [bacterium]|nr:hypothetical protein [bacterium]